MLLLLAAVLSAVFALPVKAQHFMLDSNRKKVTLPFKMVRNMVLIEMSINDQGPFNFILDSGVGLLLITDPKLVDSLHILNKRTVKIPGLGEGVDAEAYVTGVLHASMPGIKSYGVNAAILKKDHFNLTNFIGMPVHGLLGYEFFKEMAVQIDFADSTVTVCRSRDIKMFKTGTRIPITVEEKKPYLYAKTTMPDGTVSNDKLVIDLGAGHTVSLENIIKNKGLPEKFITGNLGVGLNGPITGFISRIKEIDIGGLKFNDPLIALPDTRNTNISPSVPRDGNLGCGLLKRFKVVFDYTGKAIYLKKNNKTFKEPFEHDMSGLEYFAGGADNKQIIISRVEPGSPAYDIGLEKYDQIVSINYKTVDKMSLEDIDAMFRLRSGNSLLLEVYHDGKHDFVVLTLKRRI